ncbi:MAG: sodium/solute symporter [Bacteroidetes bacterium]|nr:sodium/solute symporter [Bacteroidota bacterium]
MLQPLDFAVIVVYLAGIAWLGIRAAGKQRTTTDYFLGGRDLPWWAVCFSVIATETSTLTVIGIPAVAFGGALIFFQITLGFLIGRILVSAILLPRYFRGEQETAYAFLGHRFGDRMRALASVTFMLTRLLADGVRLFATAIPLKVIALSAGWEISYATIIIVIGLVTICYTFIGGLKAVVWVDTVQMIIYVGGAVLAVFLLLGHLPADWLARAVADGKTQILNTSMSLTDWLTQPYTFVTALVGGTVFSMASHGADQLIVQRILACRSLKDGRRAIIWSGVGVMIQFALFLLVGLLLWAYYNGATLDALGLSRGDEVFPKFIVEGMPAGISGLLLAGIIAAAMSTLSSSLNALAGASIFDVFQRFSSRSLSDASALRLSRIMTLFWGAAIIGFAMLFTDMQNPVVELGLSIASFTYGGLLGAFLLGILSKKAREVDAIIAFVATIVLMTVVIFSVFYSSVEGSWLFAWRPGADLKAELGLVSLAWPLYTVFGAAGMILLGSILGLRHRDSGVAGDSTERSAPTTT